MIDSLGKESQSISLTYSIIPYQTIHYKLSPEFEPNTQGRTIAEGGCFKDFLVIAPMELLHSDMQSYPKVSSITDRGMLIEFRVYQSVIINIMDHFS